MPTLVALNATGVKGAGAFDANDPPGETRLELRMPSAKKNAIPKIHSGKTPNRIHYIPEWAERRNLIQADIGKQLKADKSTVSRWFDGALPTEMYLIPLAELLGANEVAALFRHPDDDWLSRFLKGRSAEERDQIKATLEVAFPPKRGHAA